MSLWSLGTSQRHSVPNFEHPNFARPTPQSQLAQSRPHHHRSSHHQLGRSHHNLDKYHHNYGNRRIDYTIPEFAVAPNVPDSRDLNDQGPPEQRELASGFPNSQPYMTPCSSTVSLHSTVAESDLDLTKLRIGWFPRRSTGLSRFSADPSNTRLPGLRKSRSTMSFTSRFSLRRLWNRQMSGEGLRDNCPEKGQLVKRRMNRDDRLAGMNSNQGCTGTLNPSNYQRPQSLADVRNSSWVINGSTRGSNQSLMSLMSSITHNAFNNNSPKVTRRNGASTSSIGGSSTRSSYCDYQNGIQMTNATPSRRSFMYQSQRSSHSRYGAGSTISALTSTSQRSTIEGLTVKPMFPPIDVSTQQELDAVFVGRDWLFREVNDCLLRMEDTTVRAVIIHGQSGTGKTSICRQLAAHSPFFVPPVPDARGSADSGYVNGSRHSLDVGASNVNPSGATNWLQHIASRCVATHFCRYEDASSCSVPDFVCDLAAKLANSPLMRPYGESLVLTPKAQASLTLAQCRRQTPSKVFTHCIINLLNQLKPPTDGPVYILIDGLDEAEYHRPETADSLAAFIRRHAADMPSWLRWIVTIKSEQLHLIEPMTATRRIGLDEAVLDERIYRDAQEYIQLRLDTSPNLCHQIQNVSGLHNAEDPLQHFSHHLIGICRGNLLMTQLLLNLVEGGALKLRTTSYSALPVTLSEVFLLMFNLKFGSASAFERVSPILSIILASLHPLTKQQLLQVMEAGKINDTPSTTNDFGQSLDTLGDFLTERSDHTLAPFHPAFREWLMRRTEQNTPKFMVDIRTNEHYQRQGHVLLAMHLSRRGRLDSDELFELGHHILKAHPYKHMKEEPTESPQSPVSSASGRDCQLMWIQQAAKDLNSALCSLTNLSSPNTKVTRLLIAAGANVNAVLPDGQPILCRAAAAGQTDLCALLIENGARVDEKDTSNFGATPIMLAAANAHLDTMQILHQHKADLLATDNHDRCALVHAAESGHVPVVSFLLQCDWSMSSSSANQHRVSHPTTANENGEYKQKALEQAFVAAASHNHLRVCQFLVDMCDVSVDSVCPITSQTALNQSALYGHAELLKFLLQAGASPKAVKGACTSPLLSAVCGGSWEIVSILLGRGLDVESEADEQGFTPLMAAAQNGHIGVMELLLSRGASVDRMDHCSRTALHRACQHNQFACVSLLIDRGCSLSVTDSNGATSLHLAAENAGKRVVQLLLDRGANMECVDDHQHRPIDASVHRRNLASLSVFLRRGAKLSSLTWSLARQHPDVACLLLQKLIEDGTLLYRKNRLQDATHRFEYAQRKLASLQQQQQSSAPTNVMTKSAWLANGSNNNSNNSNTNDTSINNNNNNNNNNSNNNAMQLRHIEYLILVGLGRCRRRHGHHADAIDCCNEALQVSGTASQTNGFEAYLLRAKCYFDTQDMTSALRDAQQAIQLCAHSTDAAQLLASLTAAGTHGAQPLLLDTNTPATSHTNKRCSPADCSSDSGAMADFEDPNTLSPTHTGGDVVL